MIHSFIHFFVCQFNWWKFFFHYFNRIIFIFIIFKLYVYSFGLFMMIEKIEEFYDSYQCNPDFFFRMKIMFFFLFKFLGKKINFLIIRMNSVKKTANNDDDKFFSLSLHRLFRIFNHPKIYIFSFKIAFKLWGWILLTFIANRLSSSIRLAFAFFFFDQMMIVYMIVLIMAMMMMMEMVKWFSKCFIAHHSVFLFLFLVFSLFVFFQEIIKTITELYSQWLIKLRIKCLLTKNIVFQR